MKKITKTAIALPLLTVIASVGSWNPNTSIKDVLMTNAASEEHGKFAFWSSFGAGYTNILDGIVNQIKKDNPNLKFDHVQKGSYDKIKTDMMSAIQIGDYPGLCVGYPDHFAEYIGNDVLTPLDSYIAEYKTSTGIDLLKDEYYEAYMKENMALDVDDNGNAVISGIPFNKSTELLGYNGVFVDYCVDWCSRNPDVEVKGVKASTWELNKIPETWQEWSVKGEYYKYIMDTLTMKKEKGETVRQGKVIYGDQSYDGTAFNFVERSVADDVIIEETDEYQGKHLLLDFHKVNENESRIISWDATDNMFITLLRQWGSEYTVLPDDEKLEEPFYRKGHILFMNEKNKARTIECLKYFGDMNIRGIFGVPQTFNSQYSSDAFTQNKVMFMCCSSGGLSYNCSKWRNRFKVAHLPYYKGEENGQTVVRKYVISQGANLAMTVPNSNWSRYGYQPSRNDVFDLMVKLTTGKYQLDWCLQTGYYPASKKVAASKEYQNFLYEDIIAAQTDTPESAFIDEIGDPAGTRVSYREGSRVNEEYYMPPETGKTNHFADDGVEWVKFVDDAFVHSSDIRTAVKNIFVNVFAFNTSEVKNDSSYDSLLTQVCNQFKNDPNVIVEGMESSKKGCGGSLVAASGIISFVSAVGVGLLFAKKNKGEKDE